jgi:hypothetical protein
MNHSKIRQATYAICLSFLPIGNRLESSIARLFKDTHLDLDGVWNMADISEKAGASRRERLWVVRMAWRTREQKRKKMLRHSLVLKNEQLLEGRK